tara:strand:+ start:343 stop:519 length:177 start_codon:yes stop_codon:yes gene_type:complete
MPNAEDVWRIQLGELEKHVAHFRRENVMGYEDLELEAFDAGLHMVSTMIKCMLEELNE